MLQCVLDGRVVKERSRVILPAARSGTFKAVLTLRRDERRTKKTEQWHGKGGDESHAKPQTNKLNDRNQSGLIRR